MSSVIKWRVAVSRKVIPYYIYTLYYIVKLAIIAHKATTCFKSHPRYVLVKIVEKQQKPEQMQRTEIKPRTVFF